MTILAAKDIGISFGGIKAIDGVSFEVAPGQILSIIGPNGAGKTTLFNIVSGVYNRRPSPGQPATRSRPSPACRQTGWRRAACRARSRTCRSSSV